jgi:hypothetical protein
VASSRTIRDAEILGLWFQRPEDKRTGLDMIDFYHWLEQQRPDLVPPGPATDPFQPIKALIQPHTKGDM